MSCEKKTFQTKQEAIERAEQINSERRKAKEPDINMRSYKCDDCGLFHLTKMPKTTYKFKTDPKYREEKRREKFIQVESDYWKKRFGIED